MVHTSSNIDPRALSALIAFRLHTLTANARFSDFPQVPGDTLSELVGIGLDNGIFCAGFDAGVNIAAAVLSDALGDPTDELRAIVEQARRDIAYYGDAKTTERAAV